MSGRLPLVVRWATRVGLIPKAAVAQLEPHQAPKVQAVLDAGRLAERTYDALDALGRDVVLLARVGQNLSQFGLKYSHGGIAVRNMRGRDWGVVHLLTKDDGSRSNIYSEGLVNFFSDNPFEMACLIHTLPSPMEAAMAEHWRRLSTKMHCSSYSLASHPWSLATQNSNQWLLETLVHATLPSLQTRSEVQQWLKAQSYAPAELQVPLPVQWAAPLVRDSIRFDEHPPDERRAGLIKTVTVDSVLDFFERAPAYAEYRSTLQKLELKL